MKVLVLGATGLFGNAIFRFLSQSKWIGVFGTVRDMQARKYYSSLLSRNLVLVDNLLDSRSLEKCLDEVSPEVIINCLALPRNHSSDIKDLISIYSLFPRLLYYQCLKRGIRLIQISSDGVFSGRRGGYSEDDLPDADNAYGVAKLLGEVDGFPALTLRTSIFGPELTARGGLLSWFLRQEGVCHGYTRAVFSGFPAVVLAQIVHDYVLPNLKLHGIYHVAAEPISKFELLDLVRLQYGKAIQLIPDESVVIDRSLSGERFNRLTGYSPPSWGEMIAIMHGFKFGLKES
jgi:dTDP-4-dehydrorhamnose reductase